MDFEVWARAEITRLRTEADALESALSRYLTARRLGSTPAIDAPKMDQALFIQHSAPSGAADGSRERPPSKFSPILAAIREAGARGLSLNEMANVARDNGVQISRPVLRSMVWHKKKQGELVALPNGNYATKSG